MALWVKTDRTPFFGVKKTNVTKDNSFQNGVTQILYDNSPKNWRFLCFVSKTATKRVRLIHTRKFSYFFGRGHDTVVKKRSEEVEKGTEKNMEWNMHSL